MWGLVEGLFLLGVEFDQDPVSFSLVHESSLNFFIYHGVQSE